MLKRDFNRCRKPAPEIAFEGRNRSDEPNGRFVHLGDFVRWHLATLGALGLAGILWVANGSVSTSWSQTSNSVASQVEKSTNTRSSGSIEPPKGLGAANTALYTMDCGLFFLKDADVYSDDGRFKGQSRVMVNPCYLIRHGSQFMMWDLGVPDDLAIHHTRVPGDLTFTMSRSLKSQLAEIHIKPSSIKYVSISHADADHIGNAAIFERSIWLIDEDEYRSISSPETVAMAFKFRGDAIHWYDNLMVIQRMKEITKIPHTAPYDVFGDHSVIIYPAPGHTPGHRVLFIQLPHSGPMILAGDLWHLKESRQWRAIPRNSSPAIRDELLASMDAVNKLAADTGARVICQHVPDDFFSLPPFPEPLE